MTPVTRGEAEAAFPRALALLEDAKRKTTEAAARASSGFLPPTGGEDGGGDGFPAASTPGPDVVDPHVQAEQAMAVLQAAMGEIRGLAKNHFDASREFRRSTGPLGDRMKAWHECRGSAAANSYHAALSTLSAFLDVQAASDAFVSAAANTDIKKQPRGTSGDARRVASSLLANAAGEINKAHKFLAHMEQAVEGQVEESERVHECARIIEARRNRRRRA